MSGILHKITEDGSLCEVARIGTPWHGRVSQRLVSGQPEVFVTTDALVSGLRVEHTMQSGVQNYLIPFCQYVFEKPGLPAVTTSTEDAGLGMEWRKSAIIPMETGGDIFPFTDTSGATWMRSANGFQNIGISAVYLDDPTNFTSAVVVMADQIIKFDDPLIGSTPYITETFTTSHLWADHAPGGVDMNTGGAAASSAYLDVKDNGRTVLLGVYPDDGGVYPFYIYELSITGVGSLVFDSGISEYVPDGFGTDFSLIYTAADCNWHAPTPDTSYNATSTSGGVTTYDQLEVRQRVVGAHYAADGSIVPVYMVREVTDAGTDSISPPTPSPSDVVTHTWARSQITAYSLKVLTDSVIGANYVRTWAGSETYSDDLGNLGYGAVSGSFEMADLTPALAYSVTGYGQESEGNAPEDSVADHVTVPGSTGHVFFIGLIKNSAHVYGLAVACSAAASSIPSPLSYLAISEGKYYGFVGKGAAQSGMVCPVVSGACGRFYQYSGLIPSTFLDPRYTSYNPHTEEVAVLHQYPVWFI